MSNNSHSELREMCFVETPGELMIAVKRPYSKGSKGFERLNLFAESTSILKEGSQIFKFDRELFAYDKNSPVQNMVEFGEEIADELGGLSIRQQIIPIGFSEPS